MSNNQRKNNYYSRRDDRDRSYRGGGGRDWERDRDRGGDWDRDVRDNRDNRDNYGYNKSNYRGKERYNPDREDRGYQRSYKKNNKLDYLTWRTKKNNSTENRRNIEETKLKTFISIPKFHTKDECEEFLQRHEIDGYWPPIVTDIYQLEDIIKNSKTKIQKPIEIPKSSIIHDSNFSSVIEKLDLRFNLQCHNKVIGDKSNLNTLDYLWDHLRCGIFVRIKNNRLEEFIPFVNENYKQNWGENIEFQYGSQQEYYKEKQNFYRRESVIPKNQWWANGNILCNEIPRTLWGPHLITPLIDMLQFVCFFFFFFFNLNIYSRR